MKSPDTVIQLYTAATGNGRRATIMLEETGLPYVVHTISIGKAAVKPTEFLRINLRGTVPLIVDPAGAQGHGMVLRQSSAILLYLAEKSGKLLPQDPAARAEVFEWMMFAVTDVVGSNTAMYQTMTEFPDNAPDVAGFFRRQLVEFLRVCDGRLAESEYLAGAEMSIADIALFPVVVSRAALVEQSDGLDNFKRWAAAIGARAGVRRALAVGT